MRLPAMFVCLSVCLSVCLLARLLKNAEFYIDAVAMCGFRMVLFSRPSKQLCWRYMCSTECPSSWLWDSACNVDAADRDEIHCNR